MNIPNEKKRTTVFILRRWLAAAALRVSISLGYRFQMYLRGAYIQGLICILYIRVDTKVRRGRDVG